MAITKQKKTQILEKLQTIFKEAKSLAFVNFKGLTVADATTLRRTLRGSKVGYVVAKKTLMRLVAGKSGFTDEVPELPGEIAVAYSSDDVLAAPREVWSVQKKLGEKLALVGAMFEGAFVNKERAVALASIPPREVLLAQFVNVINSPIQRMAIVLGQVAKRRSGTIEIKS